jgi:hypothetical protein
MRDGVDLYDQVEAMELMISGIHDARTSHSILSMIATRTDSVRLARAALDALEKSGFEIVRKHTG